VSLQGLANLPLP